MKTLTRQHYFSIAVFTLILSLFICSLPQRMPNEDEAVIAGHAYSYDQLGFVKSDLYGGYLQGEYAWEKGQYFYHKLFVLTGVAFIKTFGFNIYAFKSISLLFAIVFFFFFYQYLRKYHPKYTLPSFLLLVSLMLYNNLVFDHSFMYRPEIMVMCLGFMSFYFLQSGISKNLNYLVALSGAIAGLTTFTHLNGIIYCVAGALLLLIRFDLKKLILFSVTAFVFCALYFFDITTSDALTAFLYQFKTDPNVAEKSNFVIGLITEQIRFFHSPREITFSAIFLLALIFNFKHLLKEHPNVLLYLLFLVVSLGVLSHGKTSKYGLNYLPYISIVILSGAQAIIGSNKSYVKYTGALFVLLFIGYHTRYNAKLFIKRIDIKRHNIQIAALIPEKNVKIAAPSTFAFNQIEDFTIRGEIAWSHHYTAFHPGETKSIESYIHFSEENNDKYILFDKATNQNVELIPVFEEEYTLFDTVSGYQLIHNSDSCLLFKRISNP